MDILRRIRRTVRVQKYRISSHANEEMSDDEIEARDIESIIFTGKVARRFTRDPRGTRYEVIGDTTDGRRGGVVCRLRPSGVLLIITAMQKKNKKGDRCEFCDGNVEHRLVRARFHFKGQTIYVDNVPAWVCARCQERYFDAAVYKRLEAIALRRGHIRKTVRFPLADYGKVLTGNV